MSTLSYAPRPVQMIRIVGLPETLPDAATEPFMPSAADEAYDLGYRLARDGEPAELPEPARWDRDVAFAFVRGASHGKDAREVAGARELGYAMGLDTEISEPPGGLSDLAKWAYGEGFAKGKRAFEEDREWLAWLASAEADRMDDAFDDSIHDADVYAPGCMS